MGLTLKKISHEFEDPTHFSPLSVLQDINLEIPDSHFTSIIGPSGCGKTTLLKIAAGLLKPSSGQILLDGEEVLSPTPKIGLVFQEFALFPWRSIVKNIEFGLEIQGIVRSQRRKISRELLEKFSLSEFARHYPAQLSGGMQQRAAIARTLANHPRVIMMDEPFGSLDSQTRNSMQELMLHLFRDEHPTVLFVSHNIDETVFLSQNVIGLSARPGRIKATFSIDLEYPRDRTSPEFNIYRREILEFLRQEKAA